MPSHTTPQRRRRPVGLAFLVFAVASAPAALAHAQTGLIERGAAIVDITADGERVRTGGASVAIDGSAASIDAGGAVVSVRGDVAGDLQGGGAQVNVDATVGGSVRVGGASVTVRGNVGDDIDAGGAVVLINAVVGGRLRAGGATLTIGPGTDVAGPFEGGGAVVSVSGHIGGPVRIGGAAVTFKARTDGDVTIHGGDVIIDAPARIAGELVVESYTEPVIHEQAVITGGWRRVDPPQWRPDIRPWAWSVVFAVAMALGTILAGFVGLLFGGRLFATSMNNVRLRPGSSLLLGVATFLIIPVVAVLLMVTVVGLTVGFAVLLVLPFLLVFGHAVAAAGIAAGLFVRDRGAVGGVRAFFLLVVGAVVVALVALIPWIGAPLVFVVLLLGTGALTRTIFARMHRYDPQAA